MIDKDFICNCGDKCDCNIIHKDKVLNAKENMPDDVIIDEV